MSYPTGQYFDPTIPQIYQSYQTIRRLHPDKSLPKNQDLPELNLYQIYVTPQPEPIDDKHYVALSTPTLNEEDGHYYQTWVQVEFPPIPLE